MKNLFNWGRPILALSSITVSLCGLFSPAAHGASEPPSSQTPAMSHSFANTSEIITTDLSLDLDVDFDRTRILGEVIVSAKKVPGQKPRVLILDSHSLVIEKTEVSTDGGATWQIAPFTMTAAPEEQPFLGQPLSITLPSGWVDSATESSIKVRIKYRAGRSSPALQWLSPEQTGGGDKPFMYSQGFAILARSWIPCQDTPSVRATYSAKIRVPSNLKAVMSAPTPPEEWHGHDDNGTNHVFYFRMPHAIPSYLIALAVGDLEFASLGHRTGVYAPRQYLAKAKDEFEGIMEEMLQTAESLFGPYPWGRADVLIMPPSFPYGGMENPCVTFYSSCLVTGRERSLVSTLGHELAHSWSGNLVTNGTWNDLWLNEGVTTAVEAMIMEKLFGKDRAASRAFLRHKDLQAFLSSNPQNPDSRLVLDLAGRDPDDGLTLVPYEKGYLFFVYLEEKWGRTHLVQFFKEYFQQFRFNSVTTELFTATLDHYAQTHHLPNSQALDLGQWYHQPGLPEAAPLLRSELVDQVDRERSRLFSTPPAGVHELQTANWGPRELQYFLQSLNAEAKIPLTHDFLAALDQHFHFTQATNAEILYRWFVLVAHSLYRPAFPAMERYLLAVGRGLYVKDIYRALKTTPEGSVWAQEVFGRARVRYHSSVATACDRLLR